MSSKAARIRELYAQGLGTAEIARMVGCRVEYVRVAGRQRKDGPSKADERYILKRFGGPTLSDAFRNQARERYADPVRYEKFMAYQRDYDARIRGSRKAIGPGRPPGAV